MLFPFGMNLSLVEQLVAEVISLTLDSVQKLEIFFFFAFQISSWDIKIFRSSWLQLFVKKKKKKICI